MNSSKIQNARITLIQSGDLLNDFNTVELDGVFKIKESEFNRTGLMCIN